MHSATPRAPHAAEREQEILQLLADRGFVAFRDLEEQIDASPATLRRDLERLAGEGRLVRVHGGARKAEEAGTGGDSQASPALRGVPFHENIHRHAAEKRAIGQAAATLCQRGEAIMIDGGSTTLQMCPHLANQIRNHGSIAACRINKGMIIEPEKREMLCNGFKA